jgi:hypothetical protein
VPVEEEKEERISPVRLPSMDVVPSLHLVHYGRRTYCCCFLTLRIKLAVLQNVSGL